MSAQEHLNADNALLRAHGERDETGWLIEENATGVIHWIALAVDAWPWTKENRFTSRFGFEDYLSPVVRVKDANEALRFARKQDAEAFITLFARFLLCATATEHEWPLASMPTVVTGEHPQSVGAIPGSHPSDQAPSGLGASRFDPERGWSNPAPDASPSPMTTGRHYQASISAADRFRKNPND